MGDGHHRALPSSDCAPSTEGCHEDGDYRSSCGDLLRRLTSTLLSDLSQANWYSICTICGSPSALSTIWRPGSDALRATWWRHQSRNGKCVPSFADRSVGEGFARFPHHSSSPPRAAPRPSSRRRLALLPRLPSVPPSRGSLMSQRSERLAARQVPIFSLHAQSPQLWLHLQRRPRDDESTIIREHGHLSCLHLSLRTFAASHLISAFAPSPIA